MHLVVDGQMKKPTRRATVLHFLEHLPIIIQMSPITKPLVYEGVKPGFVSGIVLIAESHISVHADGLGINVDIFSCKDFNQRKAIDFTISTFNIVQESVEILLIDRITPDSAERILAEVEEDRR